MGKLTRFLNDVRGWRARVTRVRGVVIELQLGVSSLRACNCLKNLIQIPSIFQHLLNQMRSGKLYLLHEIP